MKLFGTDGVRGTANQHPMTAEVALTLGMAAGAYFHRGTHRPRAIIAKDTRLSGYLLEPALTSGLIASGMDVVLVGPLPTPAVAMLVRAMRADLGIMISASHNPYFDNGIKLFGPDGYKLSDAAEHAIETLVTNPATITRAAPQALGRARRLDDARGRYIEFAKSAFPRPLTLEGLKIVLDCANGAAYQVGPLIFSELGAEVIALGTAPDGLNINHECGSIAPLALCRAVVEHRAHLGIALDGDADRVVLSDETGHLLDGDQLMAMIARYWQTSGRLKGGAVVATLMSNLGLERFLETLGLRLVRTPVGDRHVAATMREMGCNVGGEQSGHIILSDYATTGDGLIAALQALAVLVQDGRSLSQAGRVFTPLPQLLRSLRYEENAKPTGEKMQDAAEKAQNALGEKGRVFIRASGTESVIRVMLEGEDEAQIHALADDICSALRRA